MKLLPLLLCPEMGTCNSSLSCHFTEKVHFIIGSNEKWAALFIRRKNGKFGLIRVHCIDCSDVIIVRCSSSERGQRLQSSVFDLLLNSYGRKRDWGPLPLSLPIPKTILSRENGGLEIDTDSIHTTYEPPIPVLVPARSNFLLCAQLQTPFAQLSFSLSWTLPSPSLFMGPNFPPKFPIMHAWFCLRESSCCFPPRVSVRKRG